MSANAFFNSFTLSAPAAWTALASATTIVDATISIELIGIDPGDAIVDVRYRGGASTAWIVGTQIPLKGVDLADVEVAYNNANVRVFVAGYSV